MAQSAAPQRLVSLLLLPGAPLTLAAISAAVALAAADDGKLALLEAGVVSAVVRAVGEAEASGSEASCPA